VRTHARPMSVCVSASSTPAITTPTNSSKPALAIATSRRRVMLERLTDAEVERQPAEERTGLHRTERRRAVHAGHYHAAIEWIVRTHAPQRVARLVHEIHRAQRRLIRIVRHVHPERPDERIDAH